MPDQELSCLRCKASMEYGFLATSDFDTPVKLRWVAGEPAKSFFRLWRKGRTVAYSRTYRCTGCGYLESYASTATA